MLKLLQYCNYIIIVMQIKLMLLLLNSFLDLGLFWFKKLDGKFSRVFIRDKDTYYTLISFVFLYELLMSF